MKFTRYTSRVHGRTAYVFGGRALDHDLEGGLEEVLESFIDKGVNRIVLTLRGMKFLHSTLFSTLLSIERRLRKIGGDLVLAEVPWFVERMLSNLGVLHRFALVPDSQTVSRAENMRIDLDREITPG